MLSKTAVDEVFMHHFEKIFLDREMPLYSAGDFHPSDPFIGHYFYYYHFQQVHDSAKFRRKESRNGIYSEPKMSLWAKFSNKIQCAFNCLNTLSAYNFPSNATKRAAC